MRLVSFLFGTALIFSSTINAQESSENKVRLEMEPGLFFNNGRSINAMYAVTEDNSFSVGIYMMNTEIPDAFKKNLFENIEESTNARVTKEFAFNFRYKFNLFKKYESNPYAGLILAWEEINLVSPGMDDLQISTFLATPHLGVEFYLYKQMIYFNPNLRSVFYFMSEKSDEARPESIKPFLILPAVSFGLRL